MFEVTALPAFSDNYIWLLFSNSRAVVVDPGDAEVVERALSERGLTLGSILLTHHHPDHVGGVEALAAAHDCRVFGPARAEISGLTDPVGDGAHVDVLGETVRVIAVPGHTRDHLAYWCEAAQVLFCGDTLFGAGCGRLFEGTPQQMWHSLQRLSALPASTRVYCAHEYTRLNLRFAQSVEPDNTAIVQRRKDVDSGLAAGRPSVPFTLATEQATNPFLRSGQPALRQRAEALTQDPSIARKLSPFPDLTGAVRTFAILRAARDTFT